MSGEVRNCGNCGHGAPVPATLGQTVECHGAPPQMLATQQGVVSIWPQCAPGWLCAVWQRKGVEVLAPSAPEKPTEKTIGDTNGKT